MSWRCALLWRTDLRQAKCFVRSTGNVIASVSRVRFSAASPLEIRYISTNIHGVTSRKSHNHNIGTLPTCICTALQLAISIYGFSCFDLRVSVRPHASNVRVYGHTHRAQEQCYKRTKTDPEVMTEG